MDKPLTMPQPQPQPQPQPLLKPPIIPMFLLKSSFSFTTISSYEYDDKLDGPKSHHFDAGNKIASDDDALDAQ